MIIETKNSIYQCVADQFLIHDISSTGTEYGQEVKDHYKSNFQRKIDWIFTKFYPVRLDPPQISPPSEPSVDRVTVLSINSDKPVNLTDEERQLLSLGPKRRIITPSTSRRSRMCLQVQIEDTY